MARTASSRHNAVRRSEPTAARSLLEPLRDGCELHELTFGERGERFAATAPEDELRQQLRACVAGMVDHAVEPTA